MSVLLRLAPATLVLALALPATAGTLTLTASRLGVALGALPTIQIDQGPGVQIAVSSGTGSFTLPAGIFSASVVIPTQLFTGVSLISSLNVSAAQQTIAVSGGAGSGAVTGLAVLGVTGGLLNLNIPLNVGGGGTTVAGAAALNITITNQSGWTTGATTITGVTTTTTGGQVINTITLTGSDSRDANHNGHMTLVTAVRVLTNAAGNLPLFGVLTLNFRGGAPEPTALVLVGLAVAGLAALGRRKSRG